MPSDGDMRQPYGPGWEDPDWQPYAPSAAEPQEVSVAEPATLAQFMEGLRRVAGPLPAANAQRLEQKPRSRSGVAVPGQTRRWVVASGASLLAVGSFALPRPVRPTDKTPPKR